MLISVIVPVYNAQDYLEQCISSIMNQSLTDIEIILVDDGSTDQSGIICDKYSQKDKRIVTIHQENRGLIGARKRGIAASSSKYITFVDADDFIKTDAYIHACSAIQNHIDVICFGQTAYSAYHGNCDCYESFEARVYNKREINELIYPHMIWNIKETKFGLDPSLCTKIIKKELLIKAYELLERTDFYYGEDSAITYPVIKFADSMEIIHYSFYYHRQREAGQCAGYIEDQLFFDRLYYLYGHLGKQFGPDKNLMLQIEQFYIFSVNLKQRAYKNYSQKIRHLFPFDLVEKNQNIILYGAGIVGQAFQEQLKMLSYCNLILWVDRNYRSYGRKDIVDVDRIRSVVFDKIVVAIKNNNIAQDVKRDLLSMGVAEEQIILISATETDN